MQLIDVLRWSRATEERAQTFMRQTCDESKRCSATDPALLDHPEQQLLIPLSTRGQSNKQTCPTLGPMMKVKVETDSLQVIELTLYLASELVFMAIRAR